MNGSIVSTRPPQARVTVRAQQVRRVIGRLAVALEETRALVDQLERLADDPDGAVEADAPEEVLCALTWGTFSRDLIFLDTACAVAASLIESNFTSAVTRALARQRA